MIQLGPDPHKWPEPYKSRYAERLRARQSTSLARYQFNPLGYAQNVLKVSLSADQKTIIESVRVNRRTLVKASHGVGKTFSAGVLGNWWYDCWDAHIVYITAPTWPQALGLTFKQLKTLRRANTLPGTILDSGIVKDDDKNKEGAHYIRALNAERGEGFQGEHSAPILIVLEEGVGVPKYIWDAAGGLMTHPDSRMFVIGNPTDEATEFGLAAESILYNVMSISALNHPNIQAELRGEKPPFPDAVRLQWLKEMLEKECEQVERATEDSFEFVALSEIELALSGRPADLANQLVYMPTAYFQGRVLGEFPTQADQQVIPKGWLKFQPRHEFEESDVPEIGCDIARFGDDRTTIITRRGPCALRAREIRKMDTVEVTVALKDEAVLTGIEPKKVLIKIDVTGGLGAGPYDLLKSQGYNVEGVNSSEKAYNTEQYKNRRSELWFDSRDRVREKRFDLSRLPQEVRTRMERELSAPKYKAPGQKVVEDKAQMKARLGYSPDLADGCNLAFAPSHKPVWRLIPLSL